MKRSEARGLKAASMVASTVASTVAAARRFESRFGMCLAKVVGGIFYTGPAGDATW